LHSNDPFVFTQDSEIESHGEDLHSLISLQELPSSANSYPLSHEQTALPPLNVHFWEHGLLEQGFSTQMTAGSPTKPSGQRPQTKPSLAVSESVQLFK